MAITEDLVRQALAGVLYPGFSRDIVSAGLVRAVKIDGPNVRVELDPGAADTAVVQQLLKATEAALSNLDSIGEVSVGLPSSSSSPSLKVVGGGGPSVAARGGVDAGLIPGVRNAIAIASGKGGVGKSTVAVNLAVAAARLGMRVGLLDADIYGPSIPLMMGLQNARPDIDTQAQKLVPFERFGVRFMSIGFLVPTDEAVIWRGPLVMKAVEQLLRDVAWGELDLLIVDMPPGTGDVQLTLSQRVQLAGAVIVTTPQDVALADAIKGIAMFRKVEVPVLGLIENMSYFACPHCNERSEIFGHGGGREQASRLEVPFLGEVPLDPSIRKGGDVGAPVASDSSSAQGGAFDKIAATLQGMLPGGAATADGSSSIFDRFREAWNGDKTD